MEQERIEKEMHELESLISYQFHDISWLSKAMNAAVRPVLGEGKNHKEHENENLATVGDALLKFVLADNLYRDEHRNKGTITIEKSDIENNKAMYRMVNQTGIIDYAFNEKYFYKDNPPDHEKVANSEHTPYLEAIIAAVYYDSGFEAAKNWILNWVYPLLIKFRLLV